MAIKQGETYNRDGQILDDEDFDFENADRGDDFTPDGADTVDQDIDDDNEDDEELDTDSDDEEDEELEGDEEEDGEDELEEEENSEETNVEDSEDEEYDEDDQDVEEDEEDVAPRKEARIPRSRLNKVISQRDAEREQREALDERNNWLEDQLEKLLDASTRQVETPVAPKEPEKPAFDFDDAESKYIDLIVEGDNAKAIKLRKQIDSARQAEFKAELRSLEQNLLDSTDTKASAAAESTRFEAYREGLESKYSFLDAGQDEYNEEAVETVNLLMAGYQHNGDTPRQALKKAMDKVGPMFDQELEESSAPERLGKTTKKKTSKKATTRTKASRKKAQTAVKQQPTKVKGKRQRDVGTEDVDVARLNDRQFRKLTEREKAIARGDIVG